MTIILHYALPVIIPQALHEQGCGYILTAPDKTNGDARLLLLGVAEDVPERLTAWRGAGLRAPVLLLGRAQHDWPVAEVLVPPFKLGRLLERMDYYAQFAAGPHEAEIVWGDYRLDPAAKKLRRLDAEQSLTDKEAALLVLFVRAPDRAWTREDLLREIWDYDAALDTHTLETHIYRLRRKLVELGGAAELALGAAGYRLQMS